MEYNYVEVNKEYFPTYCANYAPNAKIETRMMTVNDVKLLSMIDSNNVTQIMKEIIRRCCRFTNMTIDDLYLADRDFLMFWLRSGSYISHNGYIFTLNPCPNCKNKAEINVSLQDLELDYAKEFYKTVNVNGITVEFKLPKINDKQYSLKDEELELVMNYTNLVSIYGTVEEAITEMLQWDAYSYILVVNIVKYMRCGIRETLQLQCPHCKSTIERNVHFGNEDIVGKADIKQILSNIIAISKYCNYQVNDDTLFAEVEIMGQIVSEMAEEENKSYEQQQGIQTLTR